MIYIIMIYAKVILLLSFSFSVLFQTKIDSPKKGILYRFWHININYMHVLLCVIISSVKFDYSSYWLTS